jgi:hypothetical protein
MAEIRVEEKRRSLAWLWILLILVAAALAYWYFSTDGVNQVDVRTGLAPAARTLVAQATALAVPAVAPGALAPLAA